MKAAEYGRYSTDRQDENSIAYQFREIRKYCDAHDIQIVASYQDATCIIGTNQSPSKWAAICPYFFFSQNFWGRQHSG